MPATTSPLFTAADDAVLLDLRAAGQSWQSIGERLGQWHVSCQRRHEKLAYSESVASTDRSKPGMEAAVKLSRLDRPSLPAGHRVSWGAIALPSDPHI